MTQATHKRKNRRAGYPPNFTVVPLSELPPPEQPRAFACILWDKVHAGLAAGNAVAFRIDAHDVIAFWQRCQLMLGRPIAVRYSVSCRELVLYPLECDPRTDRPRANQGDDPEQLTAMRTAAERLRHTASVWFIVSDALVFAAGRVWRGGVLRDALAEFVVRRGSGSYPLMFDHAAFERWCAALRSDPDLAAALGKSTADRSDSPQGIEQGGNQKCQ